MSLDQAPHRIVATVLGAGAMGAQIAAHLANAGVRAHLLDILPPDLPEGAKASARNAVAAGALKKLAKSKPPAFMSKSFAKRVSVGNLEDDLEKAVAESDLVIEAVIERLDIKKALFERVAAAASESCILATNTSGIPIGDIAEAIPESARSRLVGLHFFNPPRFMHLLEVIPSSHTSEDVVAEVSRFSEHVLGKGVVDCRDTPNFIGNRIGIGEMLLTFDVTRQGGYTIEEVDMLNGPLMGRPKTGSYRLGDMVGLDVVGHVVRNLQSGLSGDKGADNYDPLYDLMKVPEVLEKMFERKMLGDKTKGGFYKKTKDENGKRVVMSLDLESLEYRPKQKAKFDELKEIRKRPLLGRRVNEALRAEGRPGEFLRKVYLPLFNYAATLVGTICETPKQIDDAMKWGYGWKAGPFELWDMAGVAWGAEQIKAMGLDLAPAASALLEAKGEDARWYGGEAGSLTVFVAGSGDQEVKTPDGVIDLAAHKTEAHTLAKNSSAALLDIGDGVACLEFRSKMNSLDEGVVRMLSEAPGLLQEKGFSGLVIGSQDEDFCVGANLMQIMAWIMAKDWKAVDEGVAALQDTFMALKHGPLPVVVAPYGRTLGGGVELTMHGDGVQACAETYMGMVEIGVGLLPAGGGLKETCRRASEWAAQAPNTDPYEWIRRGFEAAATANIAMSAHQCVEAGFFSVNDGITFHKSRVIADAKKRVLSLAQAGYTPPDPDEPIQVIGAPRGASFLLGAQLFEWGGYASEHDKLIGQKIAHVLSGGMLATAGTVTAQTLLDLEREAFLSLAGEEKTLARIQQMLTTGKPLRN